LPYYVTCTIRLKSGVRIFEQLIAWCNEGGLEVDAMARARHVSEKVREMDESAK
jgi:hypothetical protein